MNVKKSVGRLPVVKIDKKIVGYKVVTGNDTKTETPVEKPVELPKPYKRPEVLRGATYKIKPPAAEHALYVTINDDGENPIELFLNSKNMEHYQWTAALTRVVSAVFRKGGEVDFLVDELKSIVDPLWQWLL